RDLAGQRLGVGLIAGGLVGGRVAAVIGLRPGLLLLLLRLLLCRCRAGLRRSLVGRGGGGRRRGGGRRDTHDRGSRRGGRGRALHRAEVDDRRHGRRQPRDLQLVDRGAGRHVHGDRELLAGDQRHAHVMHLRVRGRDGARVDGGRREGDGERLL